MPKIDEKLNALKNVALRDILHQIKSQSLMPRVINKPSDLRGQTIFTRPLILVGPLNLKQKNLVAHDTYVLGKVNADFKQVNNLTVMNGFAVKIRLYNKYKPTKPIKIGRVTGVIKVLYYEETIYTPPKNLFGYLPKNYTVRVRSYGSVLDADIGTIESPVRFYYRCVNFAELKNFSIKNQEDCYTVRFFKNCTNYSRIDGQNSKEITVFADSDFVNNGTICNLSSQKNRHGTFAVRNNFANLGVIKNIHAGRFTAFDVMNNFENFGNIENLSSQGRHALQADCNFQNFGTIKSLKSNNKAAISVQNDFCNHGKISNIQSKNAVCIEKAKNFLNYGEIKQLSSRKHKISVLNNSLKGNEVIMQENK